MAMSFPIPLSEFWSLLPIRQLRFTLPGASTHARTRGGEILPADIGTRLWTAQVELGDLTRGEWGRVRPLIELLAGAGTSCLITDSSRPFPDADPGGAGLAGRSPTVSSAPNARQLTITGLAPGYVLRADDLLSYRYGSNPVRHALHAVVAGGAASGSGNLTVQIIPHIETAIAPGTAIAFARPACKAVLVPESYEPGWTRAGGIQTGVTFTLQQTLR